MHNKNELASGIHLGFDWKVTHNLGFRCGYVAIPEGHPWFGSDYTEIDAKVYGGLTYAVFKDGEFWIGFDCAHAEDAPDPNLGESSFPGIVRSTLFVVKECEKLCEQAYESQMEAERNRNSA